MADGYVMSCLFRDSFDVRVVRLMQTDETETIKASP